MEHKKNSHFVPTKDIYEAAIASPPSFTRRALLSLWTVVGLGALIWFAWSEPFSTWLFDALMAAGVAPWIVKFVGVPLVMALRAVVMVEAAGYAFHRFMQHVGWFTRRAYFFRRGQHFHWMHHMILYPIGRFYKRTSEYINSEKGLGLSWVLPAAVVAAIFVVTHGINIGTVAFLGGFYLYARHVVDVTHSRFHMQNHPWIGKPYFKWLEDIHVLHHWDQRTNFTIVHPAMDILFGTYLPPKGHEEQIRIALEDRELTVSDLINWRYLLVEATPAEYAAFISNARKHPRSLRKINHLLKVLDDRIASHPDDSQARDLRGKAIDLLTVIGKAPTP
jgi:hypothetical protein